MIQKYVLQIVTKLSLCYWKQKCLGQSNKYCNWYSSTS